jgi:hypothetical protein
VDRADRVLDPVANIVRVTDRHRLRHDQVNPRRSTGPPAASSGRDPSDPPALAAIAALIASSSSAGTALSISPSTESEMTFQP